MNKDNPLTINDVTFPDEDQAILRSACRQYLVDKHCTLWSDFDIQNEKRLDDAVEWLFAQVTGVSEYVLREMSRN